MIYIILTAMVELLIQNRTYEKAKITKFGGSDSIARIMMMGMMLKQQNVILEMTRNF